jgi:hypothetical protein
LSNIEQGLSRIRPPEGYEAEVRELQEFAYSCAVIKQPASICGVAYHYPFPRLTYLYWGEKDKPILNTEVIEDLSFKKFMKSFKNKFEFDVVWQGKQAVPITDAYRFDPDEAPERVASIGADGLREYEIAQDDEGYVGLRQVSGPPDPRAAGGKLLARAKLSGK